MKLISLRIPDNYYNNLRLLSRQEGRYLSDIVRFAISYYLNEKRSEDLKKIKQEKGEKA